VIPRFHADPTANGTVEIECVNMPDAPSVRKVRPVFVLRMGEDADVPFLDATRAPETNSFVQPTGEANDANLMGATSLPLVDHSFVLLTEVVVAAP
jgi:hypothetical protein